MKRTIRLMALLTGLVASQICIAQAPAGAPAGSTGECKDGTYSTAASKSGACSGHKGVKTWYAAAAPAKTSAAKPTQTPPPTPAAKPTPAAAPTPAQAPTKPVASTTTAAPGGGAGQVWLNSATNVYHCSGTKYYGKTKAGAYMTEGAAKAKGAHPDHGKPCS